jgi:arylsulfatase
MNFRLCLPLIAALLPALLHAAPPNVVLILADDLGYGDVGCFGARKCKTPNLDKLASEGTKFTDFYVAQAVCTASRAALMTGCYPNRVGLAGALNHTSKNGINPDEFLLPEMFKKAGYATAAYGKWHLGTAIEFNPLRHGFDEFFGIPYSNDNSKYHPTMAAEMPPLPLYDGEKIIEHDADQALFTKRFTERATDFIAKNKSKPFFLYVPHVMPHVPIFASPQFKGKSGTGLYADVVAELDWSVGEIMQSLADNGVADNTLVIFFSDNGPFLSYGNHAGSSGPLREGKLTSFDGGMRVPCLMRWPGVIPAGGRQREPIMAIDLLPTLAKLLKVPLPMTPRDGVDVMDVLTVQRGATSPHQALAFYAGDELQAIRSGPWKLHFAHQYLTVNGPPGKDGKPANHANMKPAGMDKSGIEGIASRHGYRVAQEPLALYDLRLDEGEKRNVADVHPDVVERLTKLAEPLRAELGDALKGVKGNAVRAAGKVE